MLDDPSNSNKYYDVVGGFMEALAPTVSGEIQYLTLGQLFGAKITNNPDVKVADLLYIYDQILSLSSFGQGTLDRAFDQYILANPELPVALSQIEKDLDAKRRPLDITDKQVMTSLLKDRAARNFWMGKKITFKEDKTTIDVDGLYLVTLDTPTVRSNDYYKYCELLLEAIQMNRITIQQFCK